MAACVLPLLTIATAVAEESTAPAAETQTFDVLEFRVLGNHVLPQIEVERAVYPHLGEHKTLNDVESARTALEQAYKSAGYGTVFVDIPEQSVDEGIVRLRVTEGTLDRVRIQGARYVSARRIRERLPAAQPGTVPSLPALQEQLAAYNLETRDRALVPVLAAGRTPGTVDLTLKVQDHLPLHASFEINNQYTADTSPLRAMALLSYDNLFNRLDSVSAQYQTSPQDRDQFGVLALSYALRVGEHGESLSFYHIRSDSNVLATATTEVNGATVVGTLPVLGAGHVFGSHLTVPFENSITGSQVLSVGLDYKDFNENIQQAADTSVATPITYTNLSLAHTGVWRASQSQFSLNSSINLGLRGAGGGAREFADKGFKTRQNYFYLRTDAMLNTALFKEWSLVTRLAGQYAVDPVISNEQFAIGGSDGVRGYLEAEELSDIGIKGTLQLQAPLWRVRGEHLQLGPFAFFDAGLVSAIQPLSNEARHTDLRSLGMGLNIAAFQTIDGSVVWAYPLVDGSRTVAHDSRVLFSIRASW